MTNQSIPIPSTNIESMLQSLIDALIHSLPYDPDDPSLDFDNDPYITLADCILECDFIIDDSPACDDIALALYHLLDALDIDSDMLAMRLHNARDAILT